VVDAAFDRGAEHALLFVAVSGLLGQQKGR
jgi:hypothetical protein